MGIMYDIDLSNLSPSQKEQYKEQIDQYAFEVFPYLGQPDKFQVLWESDKDIVDDLKLPNNCIVKRI